MPPIYTYTANDFTESTSHACDLLGAVGGDMNCDGLVGFGDTNPFVSLLTQP